MLLALGPLQLDTAVRTVVVGVVTGSAPAAVEHAATGADAVWLCDAAPAGQVAQLCRETGLPIGVTVDDLDLDLLDELVAAGAAAIESGSPGAVEAAAVRRLAMWCDPVQADRARQAGIPAERLVCEAAPGGTGVPGATVAGAGPATWGAVVRAVHDGARVVRTADVRSVRRVVTVTDRLRSARLTSQPETST